MVKRLLRLIGLVVLVLLTIVLIKTATYSSRQEAIEPVQAEAIGDQAVQHLADVIKIRTVSYDDGANFDTSAFLHFISYLSQTYPLCDSLLEKEVVNNYSLLYKWTGSDATLAPAIFMGHIDVVPADEGHGEKWEVPPFSGQISDGFLWGRGSMDDKVNIVGLMEAAEMFLKEGIKPKRTIYFAFGHDEEIGGRNGALKIAELLEKRGVMAEFLLDEGLLITKGIVPGIEQPVALVGIAEKGYLSLELSVATEGGHSSMPPKETAIGIISRAVARLERQPFIARISEPVQQFLDHVGPEMPFLSRMAFANQWLLEDVIIGKYQKSASGSAVVRTTTAPVIFRSGVKDNVLPQQALAVLNFRILPGETTESVTARVKALVDDKRVNIKAVNHSNEPSRVSEVAGPGFSAIVKSTKEVFPNTLTAPSLVVGATDARHYSRVTKNAYRFLPIIAQQEDLKRLHGANERISVDNFKDCIRFYRRLILNSCQ